VGPYGIARARTLEQLADSFEFTPLAEAAAAAFGCIHLSAEEARLVSHGARLPASAGKLGPRGKGLDETGLASGVPVAAFDPDGSLTALLVREGDEMRPLAVFVP
jgi:tRNA pseudouridine55 synthase